MSETALFLLTNAENRMSITLTHLESDEATENSLGIIHIMIHGVRNNGEDMSGKPGSELNGADEP